MLVRMSLRGAIATLKTGAECSTEVSAVSPAALTGKLTDALDAQGITVEITGVKVTQKTLTSSVSSIGTM